MQISISISVDSIVTYFKFCIAKDSTKLQKIKHFVLAYAIRHYYRIRVGILYLTKRFLFLFFFARAGQKIHFQTLEKLYFFKVEQSWEKNFKKFSMHCVCSTIPLFRNKSMMLDCNDLAKQSINICHIFGIWKKPSFFLYSFWKQDMKKGGKRFHIC